jgi:hypothetical protein
MRHRLGGPCVDWRQHHILRVPLKQARRPRDDERVPVATVSLSPKEPLDTPLVDPKEHVSIDQSVPLDWRYAILKRPNEASIVHRFLVAQYRPAVSMVDDGHQLTAV